MPREPLTLAPPTLYELFPEAKTLDEKAFKFLEMKYECESYRRTAKRLSIDPKTVKSIFEFLENTDVGVRFNAILAEQTEDFYSSKNLTNLFESFHKEILRLEGMIKKALKEGDKAYTAKLIAEKRMWMQNMLNASLQCKPITDGVRKENADEKAKEALDQYKDLLDDYGSPTPGDKLAN